jgi:hypothetical protein
VRENIKCGEKSMPEEWRPEEGRAERRADPPGDLRVKL